jgi:hypothetical protein
MTGTISRQTLLLSQITMLTNSPTLLSLHLAMKTRSLIKLVVTLYRETRPEKNCTLGSQAFTNISLVLWSLVFLHLGESSISEMAYIKHVQ